MTKLFALALAAVSSTACAQTPAINPMPDGSRETVSTAIAYRF
jgi:hypothetical protein